MDEDRRNRFDLDQAINARLDHGAIGNDDTEASLQAMAVLIDADLTNSQRVEAFEAVMRSLLSQLDALHLAQFRQVAATEGEAAAMSYLARLTVPVDEVDRG